MPTRLSQRAPTSTVDPYTEQALLNPWPLCCELRDMGPAVWLEKYGMFALTRYDVVMRALRDWEAFASSFGVMMNDDMNGLLRGNTPRRASKPMTIDVTPEREAASPAAVLAGRIKRANNPPALA
jgi:cytochrome P450